MEEHCISNISDALTKGHPAQWLALQTQTYHANGKLFAIHKNRPNFKFDCTFLPACVGETPVKSLGKTHPANWQ